MFMEKLCMVECSFNPKKISALIISYLPAMKQKKRPKLVKKFV